MQEYLASSDAGPQQQPAPAIPKQPTIDSEPVSV